MPEPTPLREPSRHPIAILIEEVFKAARREGLSISAAADVAAEEVRTRVESDLKTVSQAAADMINIQSIFGAKSGEPLVDFRYGLEHFTLDVEAARRHALSILTCAEAAMQDASMYRWATLGPLGFSPAQGASLINELRRFRGDTDREDWRTADQRGADGPGRPDFPPIGTQSPRA